MSRPKSITDDEIIESLNGGMSVAEIADEFCIDKSTIYKRLKNLNVVLSHKNIKHDFDEAFPKNNNSVNLDFVCFDLETTNLTADFSIILCACIKPFGRAPIVFRADECNKNWKTHRMDDTIIVQKIAKELSKHAIVITHYGSKFDLPFLKAKMAKCCIPTLPPMFNIDTWRIAKNNFQIGSRRLANMSVYFELGKKSGVDGPLWLKAGMDGDKKAMDEIVEHNIQDVILLERLASLSFPYLKSIPKV